MHRSFLSGHSEDGTMLRRDVGTVLDDLVKLHDFVDWLHTSIMISAWRQQLSIRDQPANTCWYLSYRTEVGRRSISYIGTTTQKIILPERYLGL